MNTPDTTPSPLVQAARSFSFLMQVFANLAAVRLQQHLALNPAAQKVFRDFPPQHVPQNMPMRLHLGETPLSEELNDDWFFRPATRRAG